MAVSVIVVFMPALLREADDRFDALISVREANRKIAGLKPVAEFRSDERLIISNSLDCPIERVLELENRYLIKAQQLSTQSKTDQLPKVKFGT
jgi:hypothetical protein